MQYDLFFKAKTCKNKCRNVAETNFEVSRFVLSTRKNCCYFLATNGAIFQSDRQLIYIHIYTTIVHTFISIYLFS